MIVLFASGRGGRTAVGRAVTRSAHGTAASTRTLTPDGLRRRSCVTHKGQCGLLLLLRLCTGFNWCDISVQCLMSIRLMLIMTIGNSFDRRGSSRVRGIRPWFAMELPRGIGHVYIRLTYTYPRRTRWCFCNACWRLAPARSTNVDNFVWNCNAGGSQLAEHHPSSS